MLTGKWVTTVDNFQCNASGHIDSTSVLDFQDLPMSAAMTHQMFIHSTTLSWMSWMSWILVIVTEYCIQTSKGDDGCTGVA